MCYLCCAADGFDFSQVVVLVEFFEEGVCRNRTRVSVSQEHKRHAISGRALASSIRYAMHENLVPLGQRQFQYVFPNNKNAASAYSPSPFSHISTGVVYASPGVVKIPPCVLYIAQCHLSGPSTAT